MNKELQALEDLFISSMTNEKNVRPYEDIENDYNVIKSALKSKEQLEKENEDLIDHMNWLVNQITDLENKYEKLRKEREIESLWGGEVNG